MSEPKDLHEAAARRGVDYIDYRETGDITQVHSAVQREHSLGGAGLVPVPMWLMAIAGIAVFWAGAYLGMFSGSFSGDVFNELAGKVTKTVGLIDGPQAGPAKIDGAKLYNLKCAACHGPGGTGSPGQYPPLVKSEYVTGSSKRMAAIILKGLSGPFKVNGVQYNNAMAPFEKELSDEKIAAIMTHERTSWGNSASAITKEQVASARKEFLSRTTSFTEAEILAIPADAELEGGEAPAALEPITEAKK